MVILTDEGSCGACEHKAKPGKYKCYVADGGRNAFVAWLLGRYPRIVYPGSVSCSRFKQAVKQKQR